MSLSGLSWSITLTKYLMALGWAIVASVGFAIGVAVAIIIFDLFSRGINEWEEIKKGNIGVAIIITSLIVMIGLLILKVL